MLPFVYPMDNHSVITLFQRMLNHVDTRLVDHGFRVAAHADHMLQELYPDCDPLIRRNLILTALLHDIGANKTDEIDNLLKFETDSSWQHAIYGYLFLLYFSPLKDYADAVLYHHTNASELVNFKLDPLLRDMAQIINIADRADIYLSEGHSWESLHHELQNANRFDQRIADALLKHPVQYPMSEEQLYSQELHALLTGIPFTQSEVDQYVKMAIYCMDFRSRYTVTHTITTTTISREIAVRMGLSDALVQKIVCGAMLHDLGKIGIPVEILEYDGKLNEAQMTIMRSHVTLTEHILHGLLDDEIIQISLRHHEKLNGSGYPLGLSEKDLTLPQRIVAVADIVSALSGRRSYKKAYAKDTTIALLLSYSQQQLIDVHVVDCMIEHYDDILETAHQHAQELLNIYQMIQDDNYALQLRLASEKEAAL